MSDNLGIYRKFMQDRYGTQHYTLMKGKELKLASALTGVDPLSEEEHPGWQWHSGPHETEEEANAILIETKQKWEKQGGPPPLPWFMVE